MLNRNLHPNPELLATNDGMDNFYQYPIHFPPYPEPNWDLSQLLPDSKRSPWDITVSPALQKRTIDKSQVSKYHIQKWSVFYPLSFIMDTHRDRLRFSLYQDHSLNEINIADRPPVFDSWNLVLPDCVFSLYQDLQCKWNRYYLLPTCVSFMHTHMSQHPTFGRTLCTLQPSLVAPLNLRKSPPTDIHETSWTD